MDLPFSAAWKEARRRAQRGARYAAQALQEPDEGDVLWLAEAATAADLDHARWELRYARLALAQLAAERDALDDRTASEVAAALADGLDGDSRVDPNQRGLAARQYNERLTAYREALLGGGGATAEIERLGRVLLVFASDGAKSAGSALPRAIATAGGYLTQANQWLRDIYGTASLPEHLPPSEVAPPAVGGGPSRPPEPGHSAP